MTKNLIKYNKISIYSIIFIFIIIYITGCANNGNNSFTIIDDAKIFLLELAKGTDDLSKNKTKDLDSNNSDKKESLAKHSIKKNSEIENQDEKKIDDNIKAKNIDNSKSNSNNKEKTIESRIIETEKYKESRVVKQESTIEKLIITESQLGLNKTKKVGVMLPLTGEKKDIGQNILNALELALFQNKESRIELIIKDTEANPKRTSKIFGELLEQRIDTFIGPLFSSSLISIEEVAILKNINLFALTNNVNLARKGVFVFGIYPQKQAERIVKFSHAQGANKIALLLPNNPYGFLLLDKIRQTLSDLGKEIIRVEFFENNIKSQVKAAKKISIDFNEYEEKRKKLKEKQLKKEQNIVLEEFEAEIDIDIPFDSIFIGASGQSLTILASELQYNGVDNKEVAYIGISSWEDKTILREPALQGGFFSTTSNLYQKNIKNIYKKTFNKDMNNVSMIAYDIVALLNAVTEKSNKLNAKLLYNKEGYIGLRGLFRLTEIGRVERVFQVKKITRKKFITVEREPKNFN